MDSIYESIVSTIDRDYQSKKDMNLSSFIRKDLSKSIIDKYKSDYRQLSHIRINNNTKGYVWIDGDSLVGFINVEDKDGEKWINSFEIFGRYKKHGLSKQIMDVAMKDLKATHLSVNKKNNVAIKIYKSIGFNTYKETDTMLFMSINESYIEESVKIRNQMGKTEIEDIKTVISSLDDNSFNDFKFKDIVYCDIKYKSKKPIAFITIRTKLVNNSTVGYVSLAVDPKYQNQGIGKSLTEKAVSWFKKERGIHFLEWHCLQDNEASKKLANYAGFREYIAKGQEEYIHFTMESSNNESYIEESKKDSEYSYSSLSSSKDIADFNRNMQIVFRSKNDMSKEKTHKSMKAIKFNGEIIGYIGFSHYNIDGKKYLGIGNFMIIPRYQSSGHGTKVIKDFIDRYKDTYDEIYCYVEKENTKAIQFYKRIADVNTKNLTKYGYYVCLYRKGGSSTNESYIEESKYDRPYSADEVKKNYGVDVYNKLIQDPVHKYRMDSGIELIHKEPSKDELERIWKNWNRMTTTQKRESDKKSMELFGKTNKDHYDELISSYDESYTLEFKESEVEGKSIVYFTKEITPQSLLKIYQFMTDPSHGVNPLHGNIGAKISTAEYGSHNFLSPLLIKDLVSYLHGVIIECNTAYVGKRNTTEDHWNTIKAHGFLDITNCDIMDEEGDFPLPVKDPYHIEKNYVGNHLKRYDSILMLSHFKGHAMAGYGGALKNMSIGMASSRGKLHIHTAGEGGDIMKADRDKFLESMVDADMSVMDYMGKENILYVNVANNLSIDCDCDANPKDPDISDIGIFASTDPVALDQACIDAVYNHPEEKKRNIINRITSRNGTHTIDCAYEKGLGNNHYVILDIDQVVEESYIEEEIENEFSPTSFVKRSSLPAKNQKNHTRYLRKKAHSNKTNNATAQNELPKYNQIGELYVEEVAKSVQVKPIFIVTSYTNTPFGKAIKTFTHSEYTHAAISFDTSLEKLYSFNADSKYSSNGYKGGISRESLSSYVDSYEKTIIQVNCIFLKPSDFDIVQKTLDNLLENEEKTKYAYSNIINILIGRAKDTGMAMVCSQFVSYILHTADIKLLDKPDNTVTPKDLSTITNPRVYKIFEGYAKDYEKKRIDRIFRKLKTKALLIKESLLKLCV